MARSRCALELSWLPALALVCAGTAHAGDYQCAFGSALRTVTVAYEESGSCAVVYHKPPRAPSVLWTAQSGGGFCEDRADELVGILERGDWSCEPIPGVAPDKAIQALVGGPRSGAAQAVADVSLQVARFEAAVARTVAAPSEASTVAVAAAFPSEPQTPGKFSQAEAGELNVALVEPDVDPPYEADDIPSSLSRTAPVRGQVKSLLEMRRDKVVVQEWDFSCGAAALATILNYQHGDPVTEREVATGLIDREEYLENPDLVKMRSGFSLLDLKRYVDERGYEGIGYGNLGLGNLIEYAPIMVPVDFNGYNHFVVFRGKMGERVLLADPAYGKRTMRVRDFEDAWLDYPEFGRVGFVVARPDGQAPPNELAPLPDDFVMVN